MSHVRGSTLCRAKRIRARFEVPAAREVVLAASLPGNRRGTKVCLRSKARIRWIGERACRLARTVAMRATRTVQKERLETTGAVLTHATGLRVRRISPVKKQAANRVGRIRVNQHQVLARVARVAARARDEEAGGRVPDGVGLAPMNPVEAAAGKALVLVARSRRTEQYSLERRVASPTIVPSSLVQRKQKVLLVTRVNLRRAPAPARHVPAPAAASSVRHVAARHVPAPAAPTVLLDFTKRKRRRTTTM